MITCPVKCGMKLLTNSKLQQLHCSSMGMDKCFHPTLYNGCNYLTMQGLKLIYVNKRGPDRKGNHAVHPINYAHNLIVHIEHTIWICPFLHWTYLHSEFIQTWSTHCGLETPYDGTDLGEHWLMLWLVAWWHQAITWTSDDLSSVQFTGIHVVSRETNHPSIDKISLKLTCTKFH